MPNPVDTHAPSMTPSPPRRGAFAVLGSVAALARIRCGAPTLVATLTLAAAANEASSRTS